ncbi:unnamed protein product [Spirodela intermedia]|uniref:Uncharacterized protein n=1 Tax=Spirodela intermedia TaxID=51605 RepID=A0A7I8ILW4_SPIIN|nr:unnamed protein product [Spirodela intermedia]CAA6658736.1 unnamed protein product [Spirodela intermedia]
MWDEGGGVAARRGGGEPPRGRSPAGGDPAPGRAAPASSPRAAHAPSSVRQTTALGRIGMASANSSASCRRPARQSPSTTQP